MSTTSLQPQIDEALRKAVRHFWSTRGDQGRRQGTGTGRKDAGNRASVTGGAHMDGFIELMKSIATSAGIPEAAVLSDGRRRTYLPGYFRPTKSWDLLIVLEGRLLAIAEFKSQVGSFGNNFNNRCEEAIGSAHDLWIAYRDGAFKPSPRPWAGFLMLLEDTERSRSPVKVEEPNFPVFAEFRDASYATRYSQLCLRLVRERLYDGACLLMSSERTGRRGEYSEPDAEVGFGNFCASLRAHLMAHAKR